MSVQLQLSRYASAGMAAVPPGMAQMIDPTRRIWGRSDANSLWTNPTNWVGGVAPDSGDDMVFPTNAAQLTVTNNFPSGTLFNSIRSSGSGGFIKKTAATVTLNANNSCTGTPVCQRKNLRQLLRNESGSSRPRESKFV